jgi:hypothetical protein
MNDVTRAEAQRRAREWLRIDFDDAMQTSAFEAAKHALSSSNLADIASLITIGEYTWVRALLPALEDGPEFLRGFGDYFTASADDGFARVWWPRVVALVGATEGNLDEGTVRSLAIAAEAIGDRETARKLNDRAPSSPHAAQRSDTLITSTVYGLLGYAPDAPKGRLLMRPEIEPAWSRLNVYNIRIGDALIDLAYSRTDERMEFRIVQTAGAYPIRLIFEPILAVPIANVFVDGTAADLDFRPHEGRIIIPVQIMLDDRRVVAFE